MIDVPTLAERITIGDWLRAEDLPPESAEEPAVDLFIWREGDRMVGVTGLEVRGAQGLLRAHVVRARWRGAGIGRRLAAHVEDEARVRGVEELFLLTTSAAGYFGSAGFKEIARGAVRGAILESTEFLSLCPDTAIVMVKRL
jgi:amino-acid N-acetyltransferase